MEEKESRFIVITPTHPQPKDTKFLGYIQALWMKVINNYMNGMLITFIGYNCK